MSTEISKVPSPSDRFEVLGISPPDGIAFLPRNLDSADSADDFIYEELTVTLRKLLEKEGVSSTVPHAGESIATIHEREAGWTLPALFVGGMVLTTEPHLVAVALNVIGNYLSNFFYQYPKNKQEVKLEIFVEQGPRRSCKMVSYRGEVAGLERVADVVRDLSNGS